MPGTRGDRARPNPGSRPDRAEGAAAEGAAAEAEAGVEGAAPDEGGVPASAGSDEVAADGEIVDATPEGPSTPEPEEAEIVEEVDEVDEVDEVAEKVEVSLEDVLAAATTERDEFRDHLLRLQADFDNYRKRVHKELAEAGDRALGDFVEGLLPVLDAVDAARVHGAVEIDQVAGLLVDQLAKQGLERVGADGDVFNPTLHDAVLHEAGDDDVQTVAQVLRAGWRWRGRVLRPAMVKVVGG